MLKKLKVKKFFDLYKLSYENLLLIMYNKKIYFELFELSLKIFRSFFLNFLLDKVYRIKFIV